MSRKAKYIIIRKDALEVPLVFSECIPHAAVAGEHQPAAAGFCRLGSDGRWRVYGQSVGLNLKSRPEDAAILNLHLGDSTS